MSSLVIRLSRRKDRDAVDRLVPYRDFPAEFLLAVPADGGEPVAACMLGYDRWPLRPRTCTVTVFGAAEPGRDEPLAREFLAAAIARAGEKRCDRVLADASDHAGLLEPFGFTQVEDGLAALDLVLPGS